MNAEGTSNEEQLTAAVRLAHVGGLHARPAIKLTKLAKRFAATLAIGVDAGGPWRDAKSISQVLAMKVPTGATLHFRASGPDAAAALEELVQLVEGDFVGAPGTGQPDG